jgi:hypothetical protein
MREGGLVDRTLRTLAILAAVGLLAAILVFLVSVSRNGIRISISGDIRAVGIPQEIVLRIAEPVLLSMPDGTTLAATVTGAKTGPVALAFSTTLCPTCGSSMLPVRFNILTGKIEWACPQCDAAEP